MLVSIELCEHEGQFCVEPMQGKSGAEPFQQPLTVYCTPPDRDIQCGFEGEGASLDPCRPLKVTDLKVWNYDGSSTGQADGHNSEVLLKPRAIFNDPFRALPLLCVVLVSCVHLIWFKRDLAFGSSGSCRGRFTDFLH